MSAGEGQRRSLPSGTGDNSQIQGHASSLSAALCTGFVLFLLRLERAQSGGVRRCVDSDNLDHGWIQQVAHRGLP